MENYSAKSTNPNKAAKEEKAPQTKRTKVISGTATVKKEGAVSKFARTFFQEDAKTIGGYIWSDVVVPAIKTTIADAVRNALDISFWGKSGRGTSSSLPVSRVSYSSMYRSQQNAQGRVIPQSTKVYYYDDITFDTRDDALKVLNAMKEELAVYATVSVAAYFDFAGRSREGKYTDNKWGWTDLSDAKPIPVSGRWKLDLPKAIALE